MQKKKVPIKQVLAATAKILAKKHIGPLRLGQTLKLPKGLCHLIYVGDAKVIRIAKMLKSNIPSNEDLMTASRVFKATDKKMNGKPNTYSVEMFLPPFIKVNEYAFPNGTLYAVLVGDLDNCLMPDLKDLEGVRDRFHPMFEFLGANPNAVIFFPPILSISRELLGHGIHCVLGNKEMHIIPSAKDIRSCRKLVGQAVKPLGIKYRYVRVEGCVK